MYIPSELNLYYVYAIHNTFRQSNLIQPLSNLNDNLNGGTTQSDSHSPNLSNLGTVLTTEDYETLFAVLEDNDTLENDDKESKIAS